MLYFFDDLWRLSLSRAADPRRAVSGKVLHRYEVMLYNIEFIQIHYRYFLEVCKFEIQTLTVRRAVTI